MTNKAEMENLFLRKKPVDLLMKIKNGGSKYISVLSKETNCTYSHTVKLLDTFKIKNLVKFDKTGRIKYVSLTNEGEDIAKKFEDVLRKFSRMKPNITDNSS